MRKMEIYSFIRDEPNSLPRGAGASLSYCPLSHHLALALCEFRGARLKAPGHVDGQRILWPRHD